jgi:hypothetical protein
MTHPSIIALGRRITALTALGLLAATLAGSPAGARAASEPVALSPCVEPDNGSPVFEHVSVDHRVIDVRRHARTLHVFVRMRDTGGPGTRSGVAAAWVSIENDDYESISSRLRKAPGGRWVASFHFPAHYWAQNWYLYVRAKDRAGNWGGLGYRDLSRRGWPSFVSIRSAGHIAMRVTGLNLGTRQVDTRHSAAVVPVRLRVASSIPVTRVRLHAHEAHNSRHRAIATLHRVGRSGTLFAGRLRVPRWQGDGRWNLSATVIHDSHPGVWATFGTSYLRRHKLLNAFRVVSRDDSRAPEISSFALSPTTVDVRDAEQLVASTVHLLDPGSGVAKVEVYIHGVNPWKGAFSSRAQLHRVDGSAEDGTWVGASRITPCHSEAGTWVTRVVTWDAAGNRRTYRPEQLARHAWPSSVDVLARDHSLPEVSADKLPSRVLVVRFDEDVVGIGTGSVHVYRGSRMINDDLWSEPSQPRPGTWTCTDGTGAASSCRTGPVRTATFTPSTDKSFNEVQLNPEHHLGVRDLAGNAFDRSIVSVH